MASNQTNTLQATVLAVEISTSNVLVNRSFAPALTANSGIYGTYILDSTTNTITLWSPSIMGSPNFPIAYNIMLRNLGSTGAGNVTANIIFTSASGATPIVLGPGDVFIYWTNSNPSSPTANYGATSITLATTSGSPVPIEYFIGG